MAYVYRSKECPIYIWGGNRNIEDQKLKLENEFLTIDIIETQQFSYHDLTTKIDDCIRKILNSFLRSNFQLTGKCWKRIIDAINQWIEDTEEEFTLK